MNSPQNKKLKQESRLESLETIANSYKLAGSSGEAGPSSATIASIASRLKSTSTLGQFPSNPLSAQQRVDKREDLDVRRAMHKTAQRNGITYDDDVSDADDDEHTSAHGAGEGLGHRQAKRLKKAEKNGIIVDIDQQDEAGSSSDPVKGKVHITNKAKRRRVKKVSDIYRRGGAIILLMLKLVPGHMGKSDHRYKPYRVRTG